jgi:hypothetical protein|tara:strand:- start:322 stop:528 length:207 start_codon:yes stop_codon:yes gene_type:complete
MLDNFKTLFDQKCDVMAKLIYLKLSEQKQSVKINFLRFAEVFELLVDDGNRDNGNKMIFNLLDIKGKG